MKTTSNNSENRKSKIKNAFLKGGAIIISFILISFTVSAQGFWKQLLTESSLSNVAMIMVGKTDAKTPAEVNQYNAFQTSTGTKTFYNNFKVETDKPLDLESWMIDNSYFGGSSFSVAVDRDQNLELENWMINNKYFGGSPSIQKDKDAELQLENWMVSDSFWKI